MIKLSEIRNGALDEVFNRELKRVLKNVIDVNTDVKKKREINIKIIIAPTQQRDLASLAFEVKSKIVPIDKKYTNLMIGMNEDGEMVAAEYSSELPGQMEVDKETGEILADGNITKLKGVR